MRTFLYILVFSLTGFAASATGGDTTKVKYDINDPRNPDCPCHQYQKLADQEYEQMLTNKAIQDASENIADRIVQTIEKTGPELTAIAAEDAGNRIRNTDNNIETNDNEDQQILADEDAQDASENTANPIVETKENTVSESTAVAAKGAGTKITKEKKEAGTLSGTKKIRKGIFNHRSVSHHKKSSPKKRKIRFGRKDNSRCTRW